MLYLPGKTCEDVVLIKVVAYLMELDGVVGDVDAGCAVELISDNSVDGGVVRVEEVICVVSWKDCDVVSENVVVPLDVVEEIDGELVSTTEIAVDRGAEKCICVEG